MATIGVGGIFVASTCNRFATETRIDRTSFEKTSSVTKIHKEAESKVKWFLGRNAGKAKGK